MVNLLKMEKIMIKTMKEG